MSGGGKASSWMVATAIAAVEALKDQGVCRWNYPLRLLHKDAMARAPSISLFSRPSSSVSPSSSADFIRSKSVTKSEATMEKVMHLNCFGPSTFRF